MRKRIIAAVAVVLLGLAASAGATPHISNAGDGVNAAHGL